MTTVAEVHDVALDHKRQADPAHPICQLSGDTVLKDAQNADWGRAVQPSKAFQWSLNHTGVPGHDLQLSVGSMCTLVCNNVHARMQHQTQLDKWAPCCVAHPHPHCQVVPIIGGLWGVVFL
jgi:hypothetical protein